ncbi:hypothetical protein BSZ39_01255 [Bowdeniella nasicola]|uniref:DUF4350 domain-containing protein n=1 Tax=Bowdeniella nasicola TaxID=208480 RepID=A0A1Q5Q571_9ACTO|nr:DUF4350 domain-containing protein [Bowdeniella nasicola]OKL54933.1 hypothetical protein BSZ39_01255 [Bowdeniella nasicola]
MSDLFAPEYVGMTGSKQRRASRTGRIITVLFALGVVLLVIFAALREQGTSGELSPDVTTPTGARALAELLRAEGVQVVTATRIADVQAQARPGTTIFVAKTDNLSESQQQIIHDLNADVVLIGNPYSGLEKTASAIDTAPEGSDVAVTAQCSDPDATAASRISAFLGSFTSNDPSVTLCFPVEGGGAYAVWDHSGNARRAIADGTLLSNAKLGDDGNAALAMRALGKNPTLVWYLPTYEDASQTIVYAPTWFRSLMWFALFFTLAAIAYWAPRFGPVATERLPVVVRGGEIVRGVGRLYASRRSSAHAAQSLREGTIARLSSHLGLSRDAGEAATIAALSAATNRSAADLRALLYGDPPTTGNALQELATELTRLESEVHLS